VPQTKPIKTRRTISFIGQFSGRVALLTPGPWINAAS
jgi:hypothetical protein